jgi:hypothetical protein
MIKTGFVVHSSARRSTPPDGRYEYRIWPRLTHAAISHLHRTWPLVAAERRSDIYQLAPQSDRLLVKLRAGQRLEIKRRTRDVGTIQHWTMPVSTEFPLGPRHRRALAEALDLSGGIAVETAQSPAHLLSALGAQGSGVVSQTVRKSRLLFESGGCRAEICRVAADGWTGLTIALEAAELPSIALAIEDLRLGTLPNLSYGDMLGRLVGLQSTPPRHLMHIQTYQRRHP